MTRDLAALLTIALWLALIYCAGWLASKGSRQEVWRAVMGGLVGLSVAARRGVKR